MKRLIHAALLGLFLVSTAQAAIDTYEFRDEAERERYRQNSRRLLDFAGFTHYPSCPTLVLAGEFDWPDAQVSAETGARFLQDDDILPYWAARYGIGRPHP